MHVAGPSRSHLDQLGDEFAELVGHGVEMALRVTVKDLKLTWTGDDLGIIRRVIEQYTEDTLLPYLAKQYDAAVVDQADRVNEAAESLTAAVVLPPPAETLAANYLSTASNRLKGISDEVWGHARDELTTGMQAGESIPQLRKRVMGAADVSKPRAEMIARTEVIGAQNRGSLEQMKAAGYPGTKDWLSTSDTRTRPSHKTANGQTVRLDELFSVGGSSMDGPHDPSAPPGETINCRCTLTYDLDEDELTSTAGVADDLISAASALDDLPRVEWDSAALAERLRFVEKSLFHARVGNGIGRWTGGGNDIETLRRADDPAGVALREFLKDAPPIPAGTTLWRGMTPGFGPDNWVSTLKAGDEIPIDTAASFTAREDWGQRFAGGELDPESAAAYGIETEGLEFLSWSGVKFRMDKGRAVPVAGISNTPKEQEWLVGRTLRVTNVEKVGVEAWLVDVETI